MRNPRIILLRLTVVFAIISSAASAHHGTAAYQENTVSVKAVITGFEFVNPHVQIAFDTKDENGNVLHWTAEGTNPSMLSRIGWTKDTLKPGDQVTLIIHPNKNPEVRIVALTKVILANGQVLENRNPV